MSTQITEIIHKSPFFAGLSREQSQDLANITSQQSLAKREILFHEATNGSLIFLLESGCIQLSKMSPDGNELVIRTIKPGEVFAEVILFEKQSYPVTATSITPSTVLAFDKRDILHLLDKAEFRNKFIASLMQKQRYLAERVRYLTSYDVEQRFFLFLREHYGEHQQISVSMSKKDLAASIGATPETFSRLIKRLKDQDIIDWQEGALKIDPQIWKTLPED
jgi:CRP-like cAMP-binding protein